MKFLVVLLISNSVLAETTFTKDAKPIFEARCTMCHNSGTPGQNWTDYNDAKKGAKKIKDRVIIKKDMPLSNATNMTEAERTVIKKWIDEGTKK